MAAQSMRLSGQRFLHSVRFKLTIAVTIVLTLILGLSAAWRYERHRAMDMEEAQAQAIIANGLIIASLQHAMMTHDPADMQSIIDNVSQQAGVRGMYLYNADGALKWYGEQPSSSMAADPKGAAVPTAIQPKLPAGNSGSAFTAAVTGEQVLRQWNVIENQPRCNGCHPAQAAMLGTLVADYSMAETNRQIAMDLQASVTSVLVTVLAVVLAMNLLLSRFVLERLEKFIPVLQSYGQGNLSLRLTPHGADEIGQLATQFNHMADGLEARARENARLYRELEDKEAARTFLLHKAIAAQEEERKYLARELHDDLAQSLTALSMTVESALQTIPMEMTAVHERLGRVQELAQATLAETSRWIQELRPHSLDDLGLAPALRAFAEARFGGSSTHVQIEAYNLPEHLPPDIEIALFRILQEGLSNAARYASASNVYVRVEQFASGTLVAHIEDDGVGFLPGKYLNPHDDLRGMGLLGMRERAALLGGTLSIDSTPGRGTRLRAEIPWTKPTL